MVFASALIDCGKDLRPVGHQVRETQLVVPPIANLQLHAVCHFFGGSGERVQQWEHLDREVLLDCQSAWWVLASRDTEQGMLREQLLAVLAEAQSGILQRRVSLRHIG